jgi:M6 family metalloprotease-like protein
MKKKVLLPTEPLRTLGLSVMSGEESLISPVKTPSTGIVKNLVVLCLFSDHTVENDARSVSDYNILFNQIGGDPTLAPTGSVKDYYLENSYGAMTLESTVTAWVTLPHPEAYYADGSDGMGDYPANSQGMVEDALNLVDSLVDFSQFDNDGVVDLRDISIFLQNWLSEL